MITTTEIDVRYPDCDMMGAAHHSVYAVWFEAARMDFFEAMGFSFRDMAALGINPPLVDLHVQYRAPVRYPGRVRIETRESFFAPKKLQLRYALYFEDKLCAEAETFHIWTGPDGRSLNMEEHYPAVYARIAAAYQKGEEPRD